jgi:transcriptional regulator GlxA family with amidase domain
MAPQSNQRDQTIRKSITATPANTIGAFAERHFSVAEIAHMWNLSKDTVRRIFQNEPGVLVLGGHSGGRKRAYKTLRIPLSIVERVHNRCSLVSY